MTLVVATRIESVPVLLGDFLVTVSGQSSPGFLPTRDILDADGAPPPGRRLSKKIHQLSDGFVVGFSGALIPGQVLLSLLYERFAGLLPGVSELQSFLSSAQFPRKGETHLVGWLCSRRRWVAFSWSGNRPNELEQLDDIVAGSGASHFSDEICSAPDVAGYGSGIENSVEAATYKAVTTIGKVLAAEISTGSNLRSAYGFGGEILVWNGIRFSYVDDIAFTFLDISIDASNRICNFQTRVMVLYKNYGSYSLLQTAQFVPNGRNDRPGVKAQHTFTEAILPIYPVDIIVHDLERLPLSPSLIFTAIAVHNPIKNIAASFFATSANRADSFANFSEGKIIIRNRDIFDNLPAEFFNSVRGDTQHGQEKG